jgi:hypothetical protein
MNSSLFDRSSWIWTPEKTSNRNAWVRFRRTFEYQSGRAVFHLTADSRYVLWINGEYLGQGPVRAWPSHWHFDSYDLAPHLRVGENVICVLVNHWGEGNFQYLPGPPGLLSQLELENQIFPSDENWRVSRSDAFVDQTPRMSVQLGFEEQFDARHEAPWKNLSYDDSAWPRALKLRPADDGFHADLRPRDIPFLTLEPVLPQRFLKSEIVKSLPYRWTFNVKAALLPDDRSSNQFIYRAFAATQIWAPLETAATFVFSVKRPGQIKLNGEILQKEETAHSDVSYNIARFPARLRAGWNEVLVSLPSHHLPEYSLCLDAPPGLKFNARGEMNDGGAWALVGPFDFTDEARNAVAQSHNLACESRLMARRRSARNKSGTWARFQLSSTKAGFKLWTPTVFSSTMCSCSSTPIRFKTAKCVSTKPTTSFLARVGRRFIRANMAMCVYSSISGAKLSVFTASMSSLRKAQFSTGTVSSSSNLTGATTSPNRSIIAFAMCAAKEVRVIKPTGDADLRCVIYDS